jgi:hypothetical protein
MFGRRKDVARVFHGADEAFLTDGVLGADDYARAEAELAVRAAWPKAIAQIESLQRPFADNGRPVVRIEAAYYRRYAYSPKAAGEIRAIKTLNPADQAGRWDNFDWLYSVDPVATVKACSFGAFQIMGFNHELCGFKDPLTFYEAMRMGAGAQTMGFVEFVRASPQLHAGMKARDPVAVALHYNGSAYARNRYDVHLRQLTAKFDHGTV